MFSTIYPSPLGRLTLGSDGNNITGLWLPEQKYFPTVPMERREDLPVFSMAADWLDAYFGGDAPAPAALPQ